MGDGWEHTKDLGRPREVPRRKVLGRAGRAVPFRRRGGRGDGVGGVLDGLTASGGAGDAGPADPGAVDGVDGGEVADGE